MSLEDDLFAQRLRRTAEIEALGFRAYGQRFDSSHTISKILADYGSKTAEELADQPRVRIAGRIQTVRRMGKAGFMHLMQSAERMQVYVRKDAVPEADYSLYEGFDLGDIVGVDGYLFRTRTGELSVHAEKLTFLSKILLAMPEKWHGLEDVEGQLHLAPVLAAVRAAKFGLFHFLAHNAIERHCRRPRGLAPETLHQRMASSPTLALLGPFEMRVDRSVVPLGTPNSGRCGRLLRSTATDWWPPWVPGCPAARQTPVSAEWPPPLAD